MYVCSYVRFESDLKYNPTDSLQSDDSRVARESTSQAATIPSTSTMLEMKFAAVSTLVVPWYPRSSEIGTVPASVTLAALELSTRIAAYIMDQPLSAATTRTLLLWILWSGDVNDSNLGE
jgi:hypothetical protein